MWENREDRQNTLNILLNHLDLLNQHVPKCQLTYKGKHIKLTS